MQSQPISLRKSKHSPQTMHDTDYVNLKFNFYISARNGLHFKMDCKAVSSW